MAESAPKIILNQVVVHGTFELEENPLPIQITNPLDLNSSSYENLGPNRLLISFKKRTFTFNITKDFNYLLNNPKTNLNDYLADVIRVNYLVGSQYRIPPRSLVSAAVTNCQSTLKIPNCDYHTLRSHLIPLIVDRVDIEKVAVIEEGCAKQEYSITHQTAQQLVSSPEGKSYKSDFTNIQFKFKCPNTFTVRIQPCLQETSQNLCFIFTGFSKLVDDVFDFFEHVAMIYSQGKGKQLNQK